MTVIPFEDRIPCQTCNRLHQDYVDAWLSRNADGGLTDPSKLIETLKAENDHKRTCQVVQGSWFKGLWPTAEVCE